MERSVRVLVMAALLVALDPLSGAAAAPAEVPPPAATSASSQFITTVIGEVSRGAVNGREFLTLQVARPVGPSACRGAVLRADTLELGDAERRRRIETAAFSAVLGDVPVTVTVPLDAARCIDGKPTFSDVRSLPLEP